MFLHAEVAAGGGLAGERRGEHAVLERHPLGAAVQHDIESAAVPRRADRRHLLGRELDRERQSSCADSEEFGGRMLVERVERIVARDVAILRGEFGEQAEMPRHDGQAEGEPLVDGTPFFGAHDRRRAESQFGAARGQTFSQRPHPGHGRRRVAQEEVEDDFVGARCRGDIGVLDRPDIGGEDDAIVGIAPRRRRARRSDGRVDRRAALGLARRLGPIAMQEELLDRRLPQLVEFADGKEEVRGQSLHLERAEAEGRPAETAELLTQLRDVEGPLARRRQRHLRAHGDLVTGGRGDELERSACAAEEAHVEAHPRGVDRHRGEGRACALEQRGVRAAHHDPPDRDVLPRNDRLFDHPVECADRAHGLHGEARGAVGAAIGVLEAEPVAGLDR